MASLSRELFVVILQRDLYGTHLNDSGKTVDVKLEKQNFKFAGNVLAEIWNNKIIDNFPVFAEYTDSEEEILISKLSDAEWYSKHS